MFDIIGALGRGGGWASAWHLLGSKSQLIIRNKKSENARYYRRGGGGKKGSWAWAWHLFGSKAQLTIGNKKSENARYYRRVLTRKNDFWRGAGAG